MAHFEVIEHEGQKFIRCIINNETVRAEAGALHYYRGNIEMKSQAPSAGGLLKAFVSGESAFKPTYTGTGEIYFGPPMFGEYVVLPLNGEEWILDQGAYVCSDIGIEVSASRNKAITGLVGGEGLYQTSVKGQGTVVMQAPGKVQRIDMQGERLAVDGSFAVARSSNLNYSVRKATKSIIGSMTSGEGWLNVFEGQGTVLLAPVPNLYMSLINAISASMIPTQGQKSQPNPISLVAANPMGCIISAVVIGALIVCGLGMMVVTSMF